MEFVVTNQDGATKARTGRLTLPRGEVQTPVFMPCGTKGMVKTMLPAELEALGIEIMLGNTYHLHLRPGTEHIKERGGLAEWNRWEKPMLTDSGGFQVFSLQDHKTNSGQNLVKIKEDGVEFRSYLDGSKHFFTPENVMQKQYDIGADIIMAFDECAASTADKHYLRKAMQRTHRWFDRCWVEHNKLQGTRPEGKLAQALFPIIQGGTDPELRKESAEFLNEYKTLGIAIGGLAVGEAKATMYDVLDLTIPKLDQAKARYLMGVGSPDDLVEAVARGVDMFDCVLPTRLARHGAFWTKQGRQNIKNEVYKNDDSPLNDFEPISSQFSKSFVYHLYKEKEITAMRLLTLHNLAFLMRLMRDMRTAIKEQRFAELREAFWQDWRN